MNEDPIAEVRRIREEIAAEFNYDLAAYGAYLRREQSRSGRQVVDRSKKRPAPARYKTNTKPTVPA